MTADTLCHKFDDTNDTRPTIGTTTNYYSCPALYQPHGGYSVIVMADTVCEQTVQHFHFQPKTDATISYLLLSGDKHTVQLSGLDPYTIEYPIDVDCEVNQCSIHGNTPEGTYTKQK